MAVLEQRVRGRHCQEFLVVPLCWLRESALADIARALPIKRLR
jgi:hypothetical protein